MQVENEKGKNTSDKVKLQLDMDVEKSLSDEPHSTNP